MRILRRQYQKILSPLLEGISMSFTLNSIPGPPIIVPYNNITCRLSRQ